MNSIKLNKKTDIGPCMDVAARNHCLYAIQNRDQFPTGRIVKTDANGTILREFCGIGNARQIGVYDDTVVVSAREDGIWILSADDLRLRCHYQTVEYATGVTLCSHFAFISCRQYGVEIIDIADPDHPVHIGLIRIGEVQSACVWNGYLFGGVWGGMNIAVVDIRDLSAPKLVTRIELQGRGDGVVVQDGILYAAIGQHRRGIKNIADQNDACFGMGNGYEIFDVRDVGNIRKIRTVYTDKRYHPAFDTWRPYLCGDLFLVSNSVLGLYAYRKDSQELLWHAPMDDVRGKPDAVTGIAVCDGKLFVATGRGGLYWIDDRIYEEPYLYQSTEPSRAEPHRFTADSDRLAQVFHSNEFPVLDVCGFGNDLALACGSGGLRIADRAGNIRLTVPTDGFCCAVRCYGKYLFSAEADAGLSVYEYRDGDFERVASVTFEFPILQLFLDRGGRFVLLGGGFKMLYAVDVRDPASPVKIAQRVHKEGQLYGDNFAAHQMNDGTALLFWHRDGLILYNPDRFEGFREIFYLRHNSFMGFGPESGIDTDGERVFYTLKKGLVALPLAENVYADDLPEWIPEGGIHGKILYCGGKIISCQRAKGEIAVTDFTDAEHPVTLARIHTNVSCGKPAEIGGEIYIPAGRGGLLKLR